MAATLCCGDRRLSRILPCSGTASATSSSVSTHTCSRSFAAASKPRRVRIVRCSLKFKQLFCRAFRVWMCQLSVSMDSQQGAGSIPTTSGSQARFFFPFLFCEGGVWGWGVWFELRIGLRHGALPLWKYLKALVRESTLEWCGMYAGRSLDVEEPLFHSCPPRGRFGL